MKVAGYCPMGCGQTLFVGSEGGITCSYYRCPRPGAVDTILSDPETEHIVLLEERHFAVEHPLRERVDGELFDCEINRRLSSLDGPPREPGRYRVTIHQPDAYSESYRPGDGGLDYELLEGSS